MMDKKVNIAIAVAIAFALVGTLVPIPAVFSQAENAQNYSNNNISDGNNPAAKKTLRIGYFPNINHAQAVIGLGRGDFQKILGDNIEVKTQVFNAGPAAIEGLLANQIDVTFVGPGPAINGYVRSDGQALRIISGVANGGAVFVVRNDAGINSPQDLANKKFATPELGNTQDIALRKYLLDHGYKTKENGGNVEVLTVKNPDIITLFLTKQIDGAWVPEPWGERLVKEANGKILVDERDLWPPDGKFVTANLVAKTDYLKNNPDVIKKLLEANLNETNWINNNNNSNRTNVINAFDTELQKLTGKTIDQDVLNASLSRIEFTYDPIKLSLFQDANDAYALGFLPQKPDLSGIYDLTVLDQVLQEKGLPPVSGAEAAAAATVTNATNATNALINSDTG
ncbi:MAG TPA: ABC transporter substrate-binding protein [Nitrososphaera sp.]|nr:ABC transporter substrate-binding protein [Nitrososphaera sp.]